MLISFSFRTLAGFLDCFTSTTSWSQSNNRRSIISSGIFLQLHVHVWAAFKQAEINSACLIWSPGTWMRIKIMWHDCDCERKGVGQTGKCCFFLGSLGDLRKSKRNVCRYNVDYLRTPLSNLQQILCFRLGQWKCAELIQGLVNFIYASIAKCTMLLACNGPVESTTVCWLV